MQAAWVHFAETGSHPLLCLLQPSLLTIYTLEGELHSVPLAFRFAQICPLPQGLILAVRHVICATDIGCNTICMHCVIAASLYSSLKYYMSLHTDVPVNIERAAFVKMFIRQTNQPSLFDLIQRKASTSDV